MDVVGTHDCVAHDFGPYLGGQRQHDDDEKKKDGLDAGTGGVGLSAWDSGSLLRGHDVLVLDSPTATDDTETSGSGGGGGGCASTAPSMAVVLTIERKYLRSLCRMDTEERTRTFRYGRGAM